MKFSFDFSDNSRYDCISSLRKRNVLVGANATLRQDIEVEICGHMGIEEEFVVGNRKLRQIDSLHHLL